MGVAEADEMMTEDSSTKVQSCGIEVDCLLDLTLLYTILIF